LNPDIIPAITITLLVVYFVVLIVGAVQNYRRDRGREFPDFTP
jgi:hypothetical protein